MNDKQRKAKAYLSSYLVLVSQAERAYEDYERAYSRACRMTAGFGAPCGNGGTTDKVAQGAIEMMGHADDLMVERDRRHAISEGAVYKLYYRALEKAFDEMERLGAKPSDGAPPQP